MTSEPELQLAVFIDDASIDGKTSHFGFGTLWVPWRRRGDFSAGIKALREKHGYTSEIKWQKVKRLSIAFYRDLVDWFFRTKWLAFHCIVVPRADLKMELHNNRIEVARMKAVTVLLSKKIEHVLRVNPEVDAEIRVYVDPLPASYPKADEAMQIIANHVVKASSGRENAVAELRTRDSKTDPGIQLCDLLLGAVVDAFTQRSSSQEKQELRSLVASMLGWKDLRADTFPTERKFNIWFLWDCAGPRPLDTRPVRLRYPIPARA